MAAAPRGLGKGLSALIPNRNQNAAPAAGGGEGKPLVLSVGKIVPNPWQPRTEFDDEHLRALAASIDKDGLMNPITVRPAPDAPGTYQVVQGERRLRAVRDILGRGTIDVLVKTVADANMRELALIENIQREDLNPLEKARSFQEYINDLSITQEEAAKRLNINRSVITNTMRLLELPAEVQAMVARGELKASTARALLSLDPLAQIKLAKRAVAEDWSTRKMENQVNDIRRITHRPKPPADISKQPKSGDVEALEHRLTEYFGVRVQVEDKAGRGRIVLEYATADEAQSLLERMGVPLE